MFNLYFKAAIGLIAVLSLGGARKTRKDIRKGEVQWVAWKGKHDSVFFARQKQLQLEQRTKNETIQSYE